MEYARPHWIPATVLLREIAERGYSGGISQLKARLAPLKKVQAEAVVRLETAPGQQMQAVFTSIEGWYNPRRRYSGLGYLSPLNFERSDEALFDVVEDTAVQVQTALETV